MRWKNRRSQVFSSARFERKFCGSVLLKKKTNSLTYLLFARAKSKAPLFLAELFFPLNQTKHQTLSPWKPPKVFDSCSWWKYWRGFPGYHCVSSNNYPLCSSLPLKNPKPELSLIMRKNPQRWAPIKQYGFKIIY